ncbi:phosphorylase [Ottowia testudinis]|uniref:Phosphorylase n=1 Tax=Ottowia testudinis TaxID=2816950 RepID=A0A975H2D9_9BURK|nr:phosphorylase [Ottowia testudinis]QTD44086.1 phosphorylase [Ottowia testudinis]
MATTDLLRQVDERAQGALASGGLQPLVTEQTELADGGLRFLARWVSTLAGKSALTPGGPRDPNFNPFLPPDPALTVGPLGDAHTAILNKFPISARHLVIATNAFREQLEPLDRADFAALARVMAAAGGLGFHNGGTAAGASQRHKHLQWIPRAEGNASLDIWLPGLPAGVAPLTTAVHPQLAVRHCFVRVDAAPRARPEQLAESFFTAYTRALALLGLAPGSGGLLPPSNLLIADGWLLLVPRSREHFEGVSINALAFGGTFYAQEAEKLAALRTAGPLAALAAVGV